MGTQYLLVEQINVCGVDTGDKGKKAKAELCFFKFLRRRLRGSGTDPSPGEATGCVLGRKWKLRKPKRKHL